MGGVNSLTASAATGGITKTATECSDGYTTTRECRVYPLYNYWHPTEDRNCRYCGTLCTNVNYQVYRTEGSVFGPDRCYYYDCKICGIVLIEDWGTWNSEVVFHDNDYYYIDTVKTMCSHNHTSSHYYNTSYGYDDSSSTFTVYPLTITANEDILSTLQVSGATATDAAISGKTVSLGLSGAPEGVKYKVTNSATGTTQTVTSSYSFTMPSEPVTLTVEYALAVNPSPSQINLFVGQESQITPNQQPATATVTYTSGNTSIAKVSYTGKITALKKGSTNITVTATA